MNQEPSFSSYSPSLEQIWSDEVRYLHSLWHIGPPPSSSANPNPQFPIPTPVPVPVAVPTTTIPVASSSVQITKKKKKKKKPKKKKNTVSDLPWPVEPAPVPQNQTTWPTRVEPVPNTRRPSAEELAKIAAFQAQHKGLKASEEFFGANRCDSDDEGGDEDDDDDDDDDEKDKVFEFFLKIFKQDSELRGYYEKNCENGNFCCLVCLGNKEKLKKRFNNCVALVQHSTAISNTKRRKAHRGFAQVVCKVLSRQLAQVDDKENNGDIVVDEGSKGNDDNDQNNNVDKEPAETMRMNDGQQMNCTGDLKEDDANVQN